MKAKELIKELSKLDPEADVVVNGEAIYFIEQLPGYYDGCFQKLVQNESKSPYYNIEGIEITRKGTKIRINTMSIEDIIWNCQNLDDLNKLIINIDKSLDDYSREFFLNKIDKIKEEFIDYLKSEKEEI